MGKTKGDIFFLYKYRYKMKLFLKNETFLYILQDFNPKHQILHFYLYTKDIFDVYSGMVGQDLKMYWKRYLFIYLGFYVAFNTAQDISRGVVGRAEETSTTYSWSRFCTVNCRPTASNYQLSHLSPCGDRTPASEVGGESVTTLPPWPPCIEIDI